MADILSLLTSIPGIISNFSGSSNPFGKQQEQLASQQAQASQALLQGTNNPLYQQLYGQYQQQNRNNMAQAIAEAQGQNRMNANMGRTPLFSNERGSENIFRTLMQQYQDMGTQSDQMTRQALGQAAGVAQNAGAGYRAMTPFANSATSQNLQGYKDIYSLLSGGNQSSGSPMAGNLYPTENALMASNNNQNNQNRIIWNQPNGYSYQ